MSAPEPWHPHWLAPVAPPFGSRAYLRTVYAEADAACKRNPPSPAFRVDLVPLDAPVDLETIFPVDVPLSCRIQSPWRPLDGDVYHLDDCDDCMRRAAAARDRRARDTLENRDKAHREVRKLCRPRALTRKEVVRTGNLSLPL